jgi:predicted metalloprotease with PDZ domain
MLGRISTVLIVWVIFAFGVAVPAQPRDTGISGIKYTVAMSKPHTHLLEVEVRIRQSPRPSSDLLMPVWTPGSYLIREFERHVQDFAAFDSSGQQLTWSKINKNTWRVNTSAVTEWRVAYKVYANELSVRTNELNSDHAFWNNAALLMYPEGALSMPSTVQVIPPGAWKVATGLPPVSDQPFTFRAENFDILYDSPVEVSNFKTIAFEVKGVPHRIVIDGEGNYDPEKLRADVKKIVETEVEIMGGEIPYRDYTFILHLRSNAGGGLEHLNSTALGYSRFGFTPDRAEVVTSAAPNAPPQRSYRSFLSLVSHEFFHLWNVKRIRPDALGPFDYNNENYTKLLWVAEGITSYYARLVLCRAGQISEESFFRENAKEFQDLQKTPGRRLQSAEESSFDAWIKYYRQDENSANSQVSYYNKGAVLGLLLDLEIRKRSQGEKSLDDVMRYLYQEFARKGRNYTPADFQQAAELMAGESLDQWFSKYVSGVDELDYDTALAAAGLRLDRNAAGEPATTKPKVFFGADLAQQEDRLMVLRVYAGSPAYDQGLNAGDQIVALNNMRVTKEFFDARLAEKRPGDVINLTIFRFDDLRNLPIKLGENKEGAYRIRPIESPNSQQRRIYESWLRTRSQN